MVSTPSLRGWKAGAAGVNRGCGQAQSGCGVMHEATQCAGQNAKKRSHELIPRTWVGRAVSHHPGDACVASTQARKHGRVSQGQGRHAQRRQTDDSEQSSTHRPNSADTSRPPPWKPVQRRPSTPESPPRTISGYARVSRAHTHTRGCRVRAVPATWRPHKHRGHALGLLAGGGRVRQLLRFALGSLCRG